VEKTQEFQEVNPPVHAEEKEEKAPYETPALIVHGRVEKLTLQTVVVPP
jgi:hypothetical protein